MLLTPLFDDSMVRPSWAAYTPCDAAGEAPLLCEIAALLDDATYSKSMRGLLSLIELVQASERGPLDLIPNGALCHEAIADENVFELIKGPLRMYWFYGLDRRMIIVATVKVKRGRRTPSAIKKSLLAMRDEYWAAHRGHQVQFLR